MKSPSPEAYCAKCVLQMQPPISGINFSNMSIHQARLNMKETKHDTTFKKPS